MTKQELEKAIEKGESVWFFYKNNLYEMCDNFTIKIVFRDFSSFIIGSYKFSEDAIIIKLEDNEFNREYFSNTEITNIIKTKAEAEHYLHHANVTRTEQLPFLTWEEFLKETRLNFIACDGVSNMILYCCNNTIYLVDEEYPEFNTTSWDLTVANFYKAYDECVKLFKQE